MKKCGLDKCEECVYELCKATDIYEAEQLRAKIEEMGLERQRLKTKMAPLARLELAVRSCAKIDMVARELLTAMEEPSEKPKGLSV